MHRNVPHFLPSEANLLKRRVTATVLEQFWTIGTYAIIWQVYTLITKHSNKREKHPEIPNIQILIHNLLQHQLLSKRSESFRIFAFQRSHQQMDLNVYFDIGSHTGKPCQARKLVQGLWAPWGHTSCITNIRGTEIKFSRLQRNC